MIQLFASQHHFYLNDSDLVYNEEVKRESEDVKKSYKDFVDKTLSGCNSIKKLSLKCHRSFAHTETDQWVRHALEQGVLNLDLRFPMCFTRWQMRWPPSVFTNKTLVKLTLGIELGPNPMLSCKEVFLPVLKSLFLHIVWYTCEYLCNRMLPVVQYLRNYP